MLTKLIFYLLLKFILNEFRLPEMTPGKPQPSNVFFTVESHGDLYIYSVCID